MKISSRLGIFSDIFWLIAFFLYTSFCAIFAIFPPLLGIVFAKFSRDMKAGQFYGVIFCVFAVILYAITSDQSAISVVLLFFVVYFLSQNFAKILDDRSAFFAVFRVTLLYFCHFFLLFASGILGSTQAMGFSPLVLWFICVEGAILIWRN